TPASTMTTTCRTSSSASWRSPNPLFTSASAQVRTDSKPAACSKPSKRSLWKPGPIAFWSMAIPTRRLPARWRRPSCTCRSPTFNIYANTDNPERQRNILGAFREIAADNAVELPLHPRTRAVQHKTPGLETLTAGLRLLNPVGYADMVVLEKNACLVATDSGGV